MSIPKLLVLLGVVLVVLGLLWPWLARLGLGRLPGDIVHQGESFKVYLPITTSILVSIVLSVLFWLFRR